MEETQGVVGSAETGSPSRGTLASLREASTFPASVASLHSGSMTQPQTENMVERNVQLYSWMRED